MLTQDYQRLLSAQPDVPEPARCRISAFTNLPRLDPFPGALDIILRRVGNIARGHLGTLDWSRVGVLDAGRIERGALCVQGIVMGLPVLVDRRKEPKAVWRA